jgi:hypothetical protein
MFVTVKKQRDQARASLNNTSTSRYVALCISYVDANFFDLVEYISHFKRFLLYKRSHVCIALHIDLCCYYRFVMMFCKHNSNPFDSTQSASQSAASLRMSPSKTPGTGIQHSEVSVHLTHYCCY